jgi:hypothetical protein
MESGPPEWLEQDAEYWMQRLRYREEHPDLFYQRPKHGPYLPRTYQLTLDLVRRINAKALELHLYPSDLVRFLLASGLDQIDAGELVIQTRPAFRHVIEGEE